MYFNKEDSLIRHLGQQKEVEGWRACTASVFSFLECTDICDVNKINMSHS